ncbi:MAG: DUF479 domain-containing protein [Bacteroidota bacterium]|nr:DUF479 domain-containing protein [Bacteroidota bacterium]
MNYLAHAYLSFNHPSVLVGNMISDFVKGKKKLDYPLHVQKGITLHRAIDTFTDTHAATKNAEQYIKPAVGRYAGAFVDVIYDHFLASDLSIFSNDALLQQFANVVYNTLEENKWLLPERFQHMLPYMQSQNWLFNYKTKWGTEKSIGGVMRRAAYLVETDAVFKAFEENYDALQACYAIFIEDVKIFAADQFQRLMDE